MESSGRLQSSVLLLMSQRVGDTSLSWEEEALIARKLRSEGSWLLQCARSIIIEKTAAHELLTSTTSPPLPPLNIADAESPECRQCMKLERISRPVKVFFKRRKINVANVPFAMTPLYSVHPFSPLGPSKTGINYSGAPYLKGRTSTASGVDGLVDFSRVFFTNGTSELPNGKVHLLVQSSDSRVRPFFIENVCVRSKRIKIREDVTEKEKREELLLSA